MRLIDADYLLGTFQEVCSAISCEECRAKYKDGTCKVEHWLKAQPTIDAQQPKKGKWMDRGDYCVCNQCGHTEQQFNGVEQIPLHTPFCAMCGAKMEE